MGLWKREQDVVTAGQRMAGDALQKERVIGRRKPVQSEKIYGSRVRRAVQGAS